MSWDEWIFRRLWKSFVKEKEAPGLYRVDEALRRWHSFCSLSASQKLRVLTTEDVPGRSSTTVYLPRLVHVFEDREMNEKALMLKAFFLSFSDGGASDTSTTGTTTVSSQERLAGIRSRYAGFADQYDECLDAASSPEAKKAFEDWMLLCNLREDSEAERRDGGDSSNDERPDSQIEIEAADDVVVHQLDKKAIQDYTLNHSFEKIDTIEEFNGNWRQTDESDELEEHLDAVKELKLRDLVRVDEQARSMLSADIRLDLMTGESKESVDGKRFAVPYPEWDARSRSYKEEWCHVYPSHFTLSSPGYYATVCDENAADLARLKRKYRQIQNDRETVRRMPDGEEIDLEAAILAHVDRRAGLSPDGRLYRSKRKCRRELSILILIDHSLSTDSYMNGHHILSVARQAVTLTSTVFAEAATRFQIDAFFSHTRNQIEYSTIKSFRENWQSCADRIGSIEAKGYTRIGPAIRHATSLLEQEKSRHRWILLLSDARPNDYDRYEGRHGIADVKQSIREARSKNIRLHAFSLDSQARHYLPEMFGAGGYSVIPHPERMIDVMTDFYLKLVD